LDLQYCFEFRNYYAFYAQIVTSEILITECLNIFTVWLKIAQQIGLVLLLRNVAGVFLGLKVVKNALAPDPVGGAYNASEMP